MNRAQEQFVTWLRRYHPRVYKASIAEAGLSLAGEDSWWGSFIDAAKSIIPVVVGASSQRKILKVQLKRAEQGLPPLKTNEIAPTVNVQASLSPDIKRWVLPGLLTVTGLVVLLIVMRKR